MTNKQDNIRDIPNSKDETLISFDSIQFNVIKPKISIIKNERFIIGSDVSGGIEKIEGKKEHDYSTAEVFNIDTLEQVAEIRCHLEPDVFAEELRRLGTFYNNALIAVEANHLQGEPLGFAVLLVLKKTYKNLYYKEDFKSDTQTRRKKLGWYTNLDTKPIMVAEGDRIVREGLCTIHSPELVSELMTFVRFSDGKTEAQSGCFDDLVIAFLIAMQMIKYAPRKVTTAESRQRDIRNRQVDAEMLKLRGY